MPYINIRVANTNLTNEHKKLLIDGATQLLDSVLNRIPETTHTVIDEIPIKNWEINGKQYLGNKNNYIYIQH